MLKIYYAADQHLFEYEYFLINKANKNGIIHKLIFNKNHNEIINLINQYDLFIEKKIYIITNASFIDSAEVDDQHLMRHLNNSNHDIYLFYQTKSLSNKNPDFVKLTAFSNANKIKLVEKLIDNYQIKFDNYETKNLLINYLIDDPILIENEIGKISLLKTTITPEIITNVLSNNNDSNLFNLIKYILAKQYKNAIELIDNLLLNKYQVTDIIQIISSQLFNLKLFKIACNQSCSSQDMTNKLNFTPYAQANNRKNLSNITVEHINQLLNELMLLDYNIKHSLILPKQGLKLLVLK
jgi:DNA polymerase III delta subunit